VVAIRSDWPQRRLADLLTATSISLETYQLGREVLERELSSPSKNEKGVFANRLNVNSHFIGQSAVKQVLAGEITNGWKDIAVALEMKLVSFQIRAAMGFPNFSWSDTNRACLLLSTAIALQSEPVAKWLADLIVSSYRGHGPLKDWNVSPFEGLALRHAFSVHGSSAGPLPRSQVLPQFYDELLAAENLEATQTALDRVTLERVRLVSDSYVDYPPFQFSPFDLFPVELLAELMIRHSGIPKFGFGVLESPLCDPPLPFPHVRDPLVDRVLARVKTLLPIADVAWC